MTNPNHQKNKPAILYRKITKSPAAGGLKIDQSFQNVSVLINGVVLHHQCNDLSAQIGVSMIDQDKC